MAERLASADVARLVGVRKGRRPPGRAEPAFVIEDDGRAGWLDQAAYRDSDPKRFFPESG
jgi:hypothetical protein